MTPENKSLEELQEEVHALHKKAEAFLEKDKASKRKPANMVAIALFMAGVIAWNGWEFYHGRNPWHNFFDLSQWDISKWRHPWRFLIEAGIFVIFFAYCLIDSLVRSVKQRRDKKAEADWYRSLDAVVDIKDYEDQDCLYFYLEPDGRKRLIHELQCMPKGSRSLHKAVQIVDPELVDDTTA